MRSYRFLLCSSDGVVSDFGNQSLPDDVDALARAEALADHLRVARPAYAERKLKIIIQDNAGTVICTVAVAS